jgi:hypothetical protein
MGSFISSNFLLGKKLKILVMVELFNFCSIGFHFYLYVYNDFHKDENNTFIKILNLTECYVSTNHIVKCVIYLL